MGTGTHFYLFKFKGPTGDFLKNIKKQTQDQEEEDEKDPNNMNICTVVVKMTICYHNKQLIITKGQFYIINCSFILLTLFFYIINTVLLYY